MAVPKKRISSTRRDKRRSHIKANSLKLVPCPHCKQLKVAHRLCPHCKHYAGVEVEQQEE
jgi:large subunit ribosomal protein L32